MSIQRYPYLSLPHKSITSWMEQSASTISHIFVPPPLPFFLFNSRVKPIKKERKRKNRWLECCHQRELWCCFIFLVCLSLYGILKWALQELQGPQRLLPSFKGEDLKRTRDKPVNTYLPQGQSPYVLTWLAESMWFTKISPL